MKVLIKRFSPATLFVAATIFLSSCNRGYGCPSNFSISDSLIDAAQVIGQAIIQFLF